MAIAADGLPKELSSPAITRNSFSQTASSAHASERRTFSGCRAAAESDAGRNGADHDQPNNRASAFFPLSLPWE
jgi:hypothetical protein